MHEPRHRAERGTSPETARGIQGLLLRFATARVAGGGRTDGSRAGAGGGRTRRCDTPGRRAAPSVHPGRLTTRSSALNTGTSPRGVPARPSVGVTLGMLASPGRRCSANKLSIMETCSQSPRQSGGLTFREGQVFGRDRDSAILRTLAADTPPPLRRPTRACSPPRTRPFQPAVDFATKRGGHDRE